MAADPQEAELQTKGCMWLAALAAAGADDKQIIVSLGGVQALMQTIQVHIGHTLWA